MNATVATGAEKVVLNGSTTHTTINKMVFGTLGVENNDMLTQAAWIIAAMTVLAIAYFVVRAIRLRRKAQHRIPVGVRKERSLGKRDRVEMQRLTNELTSDDEDDTTLFDSSVMHHR